MENAKPRLSSLSSKCCNLTTHQRHVNVSKKKRPLNIFQQGIQCLVVDDCPVCHVGESLGEAHTKVFQDHGAPPRRDKPDGAANRKYKRAISAQLGSRGLSMRRGRASTV